MKIMRNSDNRFVVSKTAPTDISKIWIDTSYPAKHIHLPMDETSGNSVADISGNNHTATSFNTEIVTGINGGNAIKGNGTTSRIDLPASFTLAGMGSFRIEFYAIRHADSAGVWKSLFSAYKQGATASGTYVSYNPTSYGGITARLITTAGDTGNIQPNYNPPIDEKLKIVYAYSGTRAMLTIYKVLDGGALQEVASASAAMTGTMKAVNPGRLLASNETTPTEFANWTIDDFKVSEY